MIKKRYIFIPLFVLVIGAAVVGAIGYVLLSRHAGDTEIVFAPTKVGTPVGDKVTKSIDPEGGTMTSADGKLTITVPKGTVAGNTQFSVQPITGESDAGVGGAYRLEPSDAHFAAPIQLTRHYDSGDLDGTVAAALQMAFQDKDGTWHAQTASKVDEAAKTLIISTTHFSDWLMLRTIGISPVKASVLVGETVYVKVDSCPERDPIYKYNIWKYVFGTDCRKVKADTASWKLIGAGSLTRTDNVWGEVYTAPNLKPSDPIARVTVDIDIQSRNPDTGEVKTYPRTFESRIKIVDRGYKAIGNAGDAQYSGVVCLDSPFTINADVKIINFAINFTPSSDTTGTWKMSGSIPMLTGSGVGSYAFEEGSAEHPTRLAIRGTSTGTTPFISQTKAADTYISLIPNDGNECLTTLRNPR